jgi:Protein of unknown function (DUF402)
VLRRQFQRDNLLSRVWLGRVVADDASGLWIWMATGSTYRDIAAADGRAFRDVAFGDWPATGKRLIEKVWGGDVLMLHPLQGAYSVWFFFTATGEFRSWYVNLEEQGTRWDDGEAKGIDTIDYDLDLVVQSDRTWHWKDEDEFAYHLGYPDAYWVDDPAAVWAEGKRVVELVEAGVFPFDGVGTDYRPDPLWTVPTRLPIGWDRVRAVPR